MILLVRSRPLLTSPAAGFCSKEFVIQETLHIVLTCEITKKTAPNETAAEQTESFNPEGLQKALYIA